MGEENSGIPDFILNQYSSDCLVSIPQTGVIRSMNVSQAFAVVISQMIGKLGWWI
jgi:tRNA G18 (ribose-2'-O)-methylase SpoU